MQSITNTTTCGELYLDLYLIRAYLNRTIVPLSPLEFDVLVYLASNPERVVRKDELFTSVWKMSPGANLASDPVSSAMKRLRRKFEHLGGCPIRTVRGVGYALDIPLTITQNSEDIDQELPG